MHVTGHVSYNLLALMKMLLYWLSERLPFDSLADLARLTGSALSGSLQALLARASQVYALGSPVFHSHNFWSFLDALQTDLRRAPQLSLICLPTGRERP